MKIAIVVVLLVAFFAGAGYYGLPVVVQKETGSLKADMEEIKQKLQKAEEFIRNEQEERKAGQLRPDAEAQKIIKTVNALSARAATFEASLGNVTASAIASIKEQKAAAEEALRKQAEAFENLARKTESSVQKIRLDAAIANIRGHIAKARTDLLSKISPLQRLSLN